MTDQTLEIIPGDWSDLEQQIVEELDTQSLIELYKMMVNNPTPFQMVSDELHHRAVHNYDNIATEEQIEEIHSLGV